jgi:hypothetical protein
VTQIAGEDSTHHSLHISYELNLANRTWDNTGGVAMTSAMCMGQRRRARGQGKGGYHMFVGFVANGVD